MPCEFSQPALGKEGWSSVYLSCRLSALPATGKGLGQQSEVPDTPAGHSLVGKERTALRKTILE